MKRFLCLLLAIVMTLGVLVSCEDNLIDEANTLLGENLDKKPAEIEKVDLDFYIIEGEGSEPDAQRAVANKIKDEFEDRYHTVVKMHFVPAAQYYDTVVNAHKTREAGKISIALVNSEALYNDLADNDVLVDLYKFYEHTTYGTLNAQIPNLLLPRVLLPGSTAENKLYASYAVPNNHVYGEYKYVLINKTLAKAASVVPEAQDCNTEEKANALISAFNEKYLTDATITAVLNQYNKDKGTTLATGEDIVRWGVVGNYEDIVNAQDEWYCNVIEQPEATLADVYSSCFVALGDQSLAERAMQIIYSINTEVEMRNLLQYGVENINYKKIGDNAVMPITSGTATYNMYLKYTGDIFKAYYCVDDENTEGVIERVCIFCTEKSADHTSHIYWEEKNLENCKKHVEGIEVSL